jgi:hypothetical protein
MTTEMKEPEQGSLDLTAAQRAEIWQRLGNQQDSNAPPGFQPKVGATVPPTMQLKRLPNSVSSQVPQIQSYNYAMLNSSSTKTAAAVFRATICWQSGLLAQSPRHWRV